MTLSASRGTGQRTLLGIALVLAMTLATFLQFALGTLAPFLTDAFDLSRARFGLLTTALFVVAAPLSPLVGHLVDRVGGRRMLLAMFVVVGSAYILLARAPTFAHALAAAGLAGVGMSAANPGTNRLIASDISASRRGLAVGFTQAGVPLGALLAATLPWIAVQVGWRWALSSAVVVAALGLAALSVTTPRAAVAVRSDGAERRTRLPAGVRWLVAYAVVMGMAQSTLFSYLPLYAHEDVGFGAGVAGMLTAVFAATAFVARILWGGHAGHELAVPRILAVLAAGSGVAVALAVIAPAVGGWSLWVGAVVFGATGVAWPAVGMLFLVREARGRRDGLATGVVFLGFYVGLLSSPPVFGRLADATGSYAVGWFVVMGLFVVAAGTAATWHVRGPRTEPGAPARSIADAV